MPTYLYKNIETGEIYELRQSMRDEAYTRHPETGAAVKRIVARPSIAFRGSGFYVTDSRPGRAGEGGAAASSAPASSAPAPATSGTAAPAGGSSTSSGATGKSGGE